MKLFPNLVWLLPTSLACFPRGMKIIQAYVLLGKSEFLVAFGGDVVNIFNQAIRYIADDGVEMVGKGGVYSGVVVDVPLL